MWRGKKCVYSNEFFEKKLSDLFSYYLLKDIGNKHNRRWQIVYKRRSRLTRRQFFFFDWANIICKMIIDKDLNDWLSSRVINCCTRKHIIFPRSISFPAEVYFTRAKLVNHEIKSIVFISNVEIFTRVRNF